MTMTRTQTAPTESGSSLKARFVALDLETTGFSANIHRIVEIGLVEIHQLSQGSPGGTESTSLVVTGRQYHAYFNPEVDYIHPGAVAVHGLELDFLRQHGTIGAKMDEIEAFINGDAIIGHNIAFDLRFMAAEFARCGREFGVSRSICTLELARGFSAQGNSLGEVCERLQIPYDPAQQHGAVYDAHLAALCLFKMVEKGVELGQ